MSDSRRTAIIVGAGVAAAMAMAAPGERPSELPSPNTNAELRARQKAARDHSETQKARKLHKLRKPSPRI